MAARLPQRTNNNIKRHLTIARNNVLRCRWFLWSVRKFALFGIYVCDVDLPLPHGLLPPKTMAQRRKLYHRFNGLAGPLLLLFMHLSFFFPYMYPFQLLFIWLCEALDSLVHPFLQSPTRAHQILNSYNIHIFLYNLPVTSRRLDCMRSFQSQLIGWWIGQNDGN